MNVHHIKQELIGVRASLFPKIWEGNQKWCYSQAYKTSTQWKGSHQIQLPHLIWRKPLVQPKPRMVKKHPYSSIKAQHNQAQVATGRISPHNGFLEITQRQRFTKWSPRTRPPIRKRECNEWELPSVRHMQETQLSSHCSMEVSNAFCQLIINL